MQPGEKHRNMQYTELIDAFDRDEVDAAFITVGMQADVFRTLARTGKVRFLSIPNNEALAAMELHLSPFKVPRGIYQFEGQAVPEADIQTVATGAHLITRSDVESSFVENITQEILKTPFQKENRLGELFEQGKPFASSRPFFPVHGGPCEFTSRTPGHSSSPRWSICGRACARFLCQLSSRDSSVFGGIKREKTGPRRPGSTITSAG